MSGCKYLRLSIAYRWIYSCPNTMRFIQDMFVMRHK